MFVNPSMGANRYERQDRLRSCLGLLTMASALRDRSFLKRFAGALGSKELILQDENDYPSFDINIIHLSLRPQGQPLQAYLDQFLRENSINPAFICATATSAQIHEASELAEAARQVASSAIRIIGGPHVSVVPCEYLEDSEYQVACVGEGVETLTEIALRFSLPQAGGLSVISGIAYRDEKGQVRLNPPREYALTLDDYPFPSDSIDILLDDHLDAEKNKRDLTYLFVGSGCPYHCVFCAQKAIHGGVIRERSADDIFAEITALHARGFRKFAIVQETILNHKSRIDRLCHLIKDSGLKLEWAAEARADQVNFELLERMRDAGLRFIQVGVETGDQELLDTLNKKIRLDQVKLLREWCAALRINTTFYMLVGLPGQDWQSILRSAIFVRDHPPYNRATMHLSVAVAIPYPGTTLAEETSVRLLDRDEKVRNWPDRNPLITVDERGEFQGKNLTETDHMTSEEILESLIYLDDFGQFLLHALYGPSQTCSERRRLWELAHRMFYMIERRTIRDLIVRAQNELTPQSRRNAYLEVLERDEGKEARLEEVTESPESFRVFTDFISTVRFTNGFQTMKRLSIPNRIKWMRLCAVL